MIGPEAWQAIAAWVAVVAAGVGVIYGFLSARRARLRELEHVYYERYWQIIDRLDHAALMARPEPPETNHSRLRCRRHRHSQPRPQGVAESLEVRKACVLYLRLCEDELRLRQSGLVSADTWRSWRKGMNLQLRAWPVREEWQAVRQLAESQECETTAARYTLLRKYGPRPSGGGIADPISTKWCTSHWRGAQRTKRATKRDAKRRAQQRQTRRGAAHSQTQCAP